MPEHTATDRKARELTAHALADLRNISVGLILPELEGASLQKCVLLEIQVFEDESGLAVPHRLDGVPHHGDKPLQVVAYRTVFESLHNAQKHAGAPGPGGDDQG